MPSLFLLLTKINDILSTMLKLKNSIGYILCY